MKKIVFVTGTRADYGKIKPIIKKIQSNENFEVHIFITGMHLLKEYGNTYKEVKKDFNKNVFLSKSSKSNKMEICLASYIVEFSKYIQKLWPDLIVVHGDRNEAFAGAIVGAMNNILVAHIEGGELSGTVDESLRHSITKIANIHFVSNDVAKKRLIQMGECEKNIHVIGSADIDVMLSNSFDNIKIIKQRYDIEFEEYSILIYHPVTTEINEIETKIDNILNALTQTKHNYIVIFPNNDSGNEFIRSAYEKYSKNKHFKFFTSIVFEDFLNLLKNCQYIIGNSSCGIRESGVFGIPTINVGSRQNGRYNPLISKNIQSINEDKEEILSAIEKINEYKQISFEFGNGNSSELFLEVIKSKDFWNTKIQKNFNDVI